MKPEDTVEQAVPLPLDCRFDARLISLYSRGIQNGILQGLTGDNCSYSFCYYDAIEVQPVTFQDGPLLKDAYMQSQRRPVRLASPDRKGSEDMGFPQILVAVSDLRTESNSDGYSREEIKAFWEPAHESGLFFASMINLVATENLGKILAEIRQTFHKIQHLVYTSFDHCDVIIFGRGDSFQEYANCIYDLCYAGDVGLEDAITLYSFSAQSAPPETDERFGVLVRLGVRDYPSRELFYQKISDQKDITPLQKYWLLERNDIAFYREDASLEWLSKVRQAIIDVEAEQGIQWYTTYDLIVLLEDNTGKNISKWKRYRGPDINTDRLQEHMSTLYNSFKDRYENVFHVLQENGVMVNSDQVWLRWLEDSYRLVVSLLSSRLSVDMGICLISQFIDLLEYGGRLFEDPTVFTRDDTEQAQKNFNVFFSNIAVLIDSMNQTNRQFIQVPSFHLPSFQVPPQIMAYYTVILRRIIQVLNDKKSVFYGFTIAPKLVDTLSVISLSQLDILPEDEWVSMNMDESSFYTLRLTTETLAHEVSHFVGDVRRNRALRKECILKCEIQLLVEALLTRFNDEIARIAEPLSGQMPVAGLPALCFEDLREAADAIWEMARRINSESYGAKSNTFSRDVEIVIWQLPQDIAFIPPLADTVFEQIWRLINRHSEENGLLSHLEYYCRWKLGQEDAAFNDSVYESFSSIVKGEAKSIFYDKAEEIAREALYFQADRSLESGGVVCKQLEYLCYMFRETFADLQAIILLNMKWADYCRLLLQGNKTLGKDHPPRMTAVTKALIDCGIWKSSEISGGGKTFSLVQEAIALDPAQSGQKLEEIGISSALSKYLVEYLVVCARDIAAYLDDEEHRSCVKGIQDIHKALSGDSTFLDLQRMVLRLTGEYQEELLRGCGS